MRLRPLTPLSCRSALCLIALAALPAAAPAQDLVVPPVPMPIGPAGPYPIGHGWGFGHHPVFPRTYSYQYDIWFNRPKHTPFVGPDRRCYWQTTVRGLPLGAPWPPY
jgi:hypothetical protein